MAESTGKPGHGETLGYDHRIEPAREFVSRPPPARRDPRADPDDDEPIPPRIDVIPTNSIRPQIDRTTKADASVDSLTNAALTLRRELAKLHQQAAAVERTIEDQRRERTDALDRIEAANARTQEIEQKLAQAEVELGDLRRVHEDTAADLEKVRAERDELRVALERAKATEAELAESRSREQASAQKASDNEAQLVSLRERIEKTSAELAQSKEEASHSKTELAQLRQEAARAAEAAARDREDAERERKAAQERIEQLERTVAEAARETERMRKDTERLQRELEGAVAATARAETRVAASEHARSLLEDGVRQLRTDVTMAFARWQSAASSPAEVPVDARLGSTASGPTAEVPPPAPSTPARAPSVRPALQLDDEDWAAPPSPPPTESRSGDTSTATTARPQGDPSTAESPALTAAAAAHGSTFPTSTSGSSEAVSTASKSPTDDEPASVVSPSSRSVPAPRQSRSRPPPFQRSSQASIPPAFYPSAPPPAGSVPTGPPPPLQTGSIRPSSSFLVSKERDHLLERLGDPDTSRAAATTLRDHPEWLVGRPPIELLTALTEIDYDIEAPIFEVARAWEREAITRALIAALRDEPDVKLREHGAWLLKHLGSPTALPALAEMVSNEAETATVRRWLLEAIERLVASRSIGWRDVGDLVTNLVRHPDPSLRDGVIGILATLEKSDEKRRLLLDLLRTDEDEIVLSSAVHALATALPIELDPAVAERLLGHPSARVQSSVMEFIERSKRLASKSA